MGTAWTYQGRLMDANDPADGLYDFEFRLFDDPCIGTQQGSTIEVNDLDVIDGYFTAEVDFGSSVFDGNARWLQIGVRPGDSLRYYTTLGSRQEVTPTPYALQTRGIFVDDNGNVCIGGTNPWYALDVYKAVSDSWVAGFHNTSTGGLDGGVIVRASGGDPLLVQSATANVLNVKQNGNVGIGTIEPDRKLTVAEGGFAVYPGPVGFTDPVIITDNFDIKLGDIGGMENDVSLEIRDSDNMFVFLTGNVGIGTSSPGSRLDIKAASGFSDGGLRVTSSINNNPVITLQDATPGDQGQVSVRAGGSDKIVMRANGDTYFNGGKVGIGTTNPQSDIEVRHSPGSHRVIKVTASDGSELFYVAEHDSFGNGFLGVKDGTGTSKVFITANGHSYFDGGNVAIGKTYPQARLDVDGDLKVSGAYKGDIGPDNGAPFPRPAYNSGWVSIAPGDYTLTHNVGGNVDDYVVDMQFKNSAGIHNHHFGSDSYNGSFFGAHYRSLTTSSITVHRSVNDSGADQIRIRIWVYN
jgi:hypothetical protein